MLLELYGSISEIINVRSISFPMRRLVTPKEKPSHGPTGKLREFSFPFFLFFVFNQVGKEDIDAGNKKCSSRPALIAVRHSGRVTIIAKCCNLPTVPS